VGAVTWKVMVALWPAARVTEPAMMLALAVTACTWPPALTALWMLVMVPNPAGRVSTKVAVVAVLGPALLMTRLKVKVAALLTVVLPATLLKLRSVTMARLMVEVPVLLAGTGSAVVLVIWMALVIEPPTWLTCTVRVMEPLRHWPGWPG